MLFLFCSWPFQGDEAMWLSSGPQETGRSQDGHFWVEFTKLFVLCLTPSAGQNTKNFMEDSRCKKLRFSNDSVEENPTPPSLHWTILWWHYKFNLHCISHWLFWGRVVTNIHQEIDEQNEWVYAYTFLFNQSVEKTRTVLYPK